MQRPISCGSYPLLFFYFPPTIIDFYVKVMKKRFSPVLRIFMKKSQYSCTIDHGYVTDLQRPQG